MEIVSAIEDIKDSIGDKGFYLIVGGIALLFVYNLKKQESNQNAVGENLVSASGYTMYPDVDKNANVIIDTLQNSISYSEGEIRDDISGLSDLVSGNFEATNNYINTGLASQTELMKQNFSEIMGSISSAQANIIKNSNTNTQSIINNSNANATDIIKNNITNANRVIRNQNSNYTDLKDQIENSQNSIISSNNATYQKLAEQQDAKRNSNYNGKLNVDTSIVDALKSIGLPSDFNFRKLLASKFGMSNYTGTYSQNVTLLKHIKSGAIDDHWVQK